MEIDLSQFGMGAIQTPKVIRHQQFHIFGADPFVEWSQPYSVEKDFILKQRNQLSSSSCTGHATMYYVEALNRVKNGKDENYSARFNYSQSFVPQGGAYIWKAMSIPVVTGTASAVSVPDGDSSEPTMRDLTANGQAILEARAEKYAVVPRSTVDQMANVVRNYTGFVTGFNGVNGMFSADGTLNIPKEVNWGHAIYVMGHQLKDHVNQEGQIIHPNEKTLKAKASWGSTFSGYHYIPECFVNSGYLFDCYVYAEVKDINPASMLRFIKTEGGKDIWLVRDGKRSLIYNASAMSLVGDWSKIETVPLIDFNAIPDTGIVLAAVSQE